MSDLCLCGVAASAPVSRHDAKGCHDCMWHNSPPCKTCITLTQISQYLTWGMWSVGDKTGEAA